MKKIINGRKYDTDTAKYLGEHQYSNKRDFAYCLEILYVKRTGEYFIYGEGGPMSKYSKAIDMNSWSGGKDITPVNAEEAKRWAEKYLDADEYEEIFGEVDE